MMDMRQTTRYPLAVQRECSFCVVTFKDFDWRDFSVHLKDISMQGLGVQSENAIMPGFVWFRERVGGHRGGILLWSRKIGISFRAGIQFLNLSREEEQFVQKRIASLQQHEPIKDPEAVIATIMESLLRPKSAAE